MNVGIRGLFIIACYILVDTARIEVRDAFYNLLNDIIGTYDTGERIILLGDMNGWVEVHVY